MKDSVRFWSKVEKSEDCWLWTAATNAEGYGVIKIKGKCVYAHRWAYEDAGFELIKGLVLDHICRVRNCIRPAHLRQVTDRVNILAGNGICARYARRSETHRPPELER